MLHFTKVDEKSASAIESLLDDPVSRARLSGLVPVKAWLEFVTACDTQTVVLAYDGDQLVGLVIVEQVGCGVIWPAVLINASLRGKGYGVQLLKFALGQFPSHAATAEIEVDNPHALAMAKACNFLIDEAQATTDGFIRLVRKSNLSR